MADKPSPAPHSNIMKSRNFKTMVKGGGAVQFDIGGAEENLQLQP